MCHHLANTVFGMIFYDLNVPVLDSEPDSLKICKQLKDCMSLMRILFAPKSTDGYLFIAFNVTVDSPKLIKVNDIKPSDYRDLILAQRNQIF